MRAIVLLAACGQPATSAVEVEEVVTEPVTATTAPTPAPEPAPYMRRPMHCCGDPLIEPLVTAYLDLGTAMASGGDTATAWTALKQQSTGVLELASTADLEAIDAAIGTLEGCTGDACYAPYGELSGLLIAYIEGSHSGDLDLAVAYSRKHDAEWIQDGVQIRSPYGDDVVSFAWGTRDEVLKADASANSKTVAGTAETTGAPVGTAEAEVAATDPPG